MIKKIISSFILATFLAVVSVNFAFAADNADIPRTSLFAGIWKTLTGKISLLFKSTWTPWGTPVVQVKSPTGQTMSGAAQSGQSQGALYIPGQFGFGGTGGVITSTPVPLPANKAGVSVSNIGSTQGPTGMFNTSKDATPGGVQPYPAPQPQTTQKRLPSEPAPTKLPTPVPAVVAPTAKVVELVVTAVSNLIATPVEEGSSVKFVATLKFSNGTQKDVSRLVKWVVVGDIGSIDMSGFFTAALGPSVSEFGEGLGSVTATYSGPEGVFLGKSPIFKVYAGEATRGGDIGGQ